MGDNDFELLSLNALTASRVSEMIPSWSTDLIPIDNLENFITKEDTKINFLKQMKKEKRI